ncbi:MAG: hypothetical protein IAG13_21830 [Deltaproteobacteria bacterium]|nr:hypothetical protein [Nannocystaceae bacterium]
MPQPSPTFRSELAAQAIPLRSLARRIVGAEHADDLAQDSLVLALSQPPSMPG